MENNIIQVPKGIRYISQFEEKYGFCLQDFPHILDKSIPGCGFTTWALTNSQNVILASPRKVLMRNKKEQLDEDKKPSFLCLSPKDDEDSLTWDKLRVELGEFINNRLMDGYPIKIIVTYDSYRKVKELLEKVSPDFFKTFYTVVDEFQSIFIDSRFKPTTELEFVNVLENVQRVCYVSATPMTTEYLEMMDQFKDLPCYKLDWKTLDPSRVSFPEVHKRALRTITSAVRPYIKSYKEGRFEHRISPILREDRVSKELVIYLNSVKDIVKIIKTFKLDPGEINIICSNTDKNRRTIKTKLTDVLGKEYTIGKVPKRGEPRKMFTFCTRTVYLGADFYSDNARSIVISDANIETLAVDITLDIPQILGRQREEDNPWRRTLMVIAKHNMQQPTPVEEYERIIADKKERTMTIINLFNKATIKEKLEEIKTYRNLIETRNYQDDYVSINEHAGSIPILVPNLLVAIAEKRAFVIKQDQWSSSGAMFSSFAENDMPITMDQSWDAQAVLDKFEKTKGTSEKLKVLCESGLSEKEMRSVFTQIENNTYENFYFGLGPERCKALGYNYTILRKDYELKFFDTIPVRERILSDFKVGDRLVISEVKETLRLIYQDFKYGKTPKATDLEEYFELKDIRLKDSSGKLVRGFEILAQK
jgi:hypothetical protein